MPRIPPPLTPPQKREPLAVVALLEQLVADELREQADHLLRV